MFCKNCGAKNEGQATFCPECGTKVAEVKGNTNNVNTTKKGSVLSFLIVSVLCFLLPFVTVSCEQQSFYGNSSEKATFNGINLLTGKTTTFDAPPLKAQPLVIIVFLILLVAIAYTAFGDKLNHLLISGASLAGVLLLFIFKSSFTKSVAKEFEGMAKVDYKIGFWLTILVLLASCGYNGYIHMNSKEKSNT